MLRCWRRWPRCSPSQAGFPPRRYAPARYSAWARSRLGFLDGTSYLEAVRSRPHIRVEDLMGCFRPPYARLFLPDPSEETTLEWINDYVCTLRYQGLRPAAEIWEWSRRALPLVHCIPLGDGGRLTALLGHYAYALRCAGQRDEALSGLRCALSDRMYRTAHPHVQSCLLAEMGELQRRLGHRQFACQFLERAGQM